MVGSDEFSTSDGVPLSGGNVGVFFSGRGYLGGGRAALSMLMRRGWSMSLYVAGRGGDDLYVDGVYTSAADVGLRLTKELESGGTWAVVAAATVSERGLRSGSTEEAFTLTGNRLYNPAWGVQQGRRARAARGRPVRHDIIYLLAVGADAVAHIGRRRLGRTAIWDVGVVRRRDTHARQLP